MVVTDVSTASAAVIFRVKLINIMNFYINDYVVLILNIFFFRKKAVQVSDGAFVESIRIL